MNQGHGLAYGTHPIIYRFLACASSSPAISDAQRTVAVAAEMIHTASLIHDDIIDDADIRRNRPTVNRIWGESKATAAGKFVVSQASCALARMGNSRAIDLLATAAEDIVYGKLLGNFLCCNFCVFYFAVWQSAESFDSV